MGMEADLIAVGPYNSGVAGRLAYPAEDYKRVKPGVKVWTRIACCDTSSQSRNLAKLFDVDIADFNTHHISGARTKALRKKFESMSWEVTERLGEEIGRDDLHSILSDFTVLAKAGFEFFFLPNS